MNASIGAAGLSREAPSEVRDGGCDLTAVAGFGPNQASEDQTMHVQDGGVTNCLVDNPLA